MYLSGIVQHPDELSPFYDPDIDNWRGHQTSPNSGEFKSQTSSEIAI